MRQKTAESSLFKVAIVGESPRDSTIFHHDKARAIHKTPGLVDASPIEVQGGTGAFGRDDGPGPEASFSSPNGIAFDANRGWLYVNDHLVPFARRPTTRPVSSLRRIALPNLPRTLQAALAEGGIDGMAAAYREFKEGRPTNTEAQMNAFGYGLLQQGQVEAAIRAFELNAETYPASFNVWDSLAEAHKTAGHRNEAIELYRKSLELHPDNTNAVQMLEELGAEP